MRTISQVVRDILDRSPLLAEVLENDIGNYSKIARSIQPEVERRLYERVSEASIIMALRRRAQARSRKPVRGNAYLKQLNDVTVRSNLVAFVFPNLADPGPLWAALSASMKRRSDRFVSLSCGLRESIVIAGKDAQADIEMILKRKNVRRVDDLSALTMQLPEKSLDVPGVYYPLLRAVAAEGISFVEITSVGTEFSMLFRNEDIDRAFASIKKITS